MLRRTIFGLVAVASLLVASAGTASAFHHGGYHGGHHRGYHGGYGYGGGFRGGYGYGGYLPPVVLPPPPVWGYPQVGGYGYGLQPGCGAGYGYARPGFGMSTPGFGLYVR